MLPRRWQDRLGDILSAVEEIIEFTQGMDFDAFRADAKTQKAVLANFAIIGEAALHVPDEVRETLPHVPWKDMREMRNFVVHAYFSVEPSIVWDTIQNDLPGLAGALRSVLGDDNE